MLIQRLHALGHQVSPEPTRNLKLLKGTDSIINLDLLISRNYKFVEILACPGICTRIARFDIRGNFILKLKKQQHIFKRQPTIHQISNSEFE